MTCLISAVEVNPTADGTHTQHCLLYVYVCRFDFANSAACCSLSGVSLLFAVCLLLLLLFAVVVVVVVVVVGVVVVGGSWWWLLLWAWWCTR